MGFDETFKINQKSFVDVKFEANRWYQIDVLMDWEDKQIALFIDGKFRTTEAFYSA